MDINRDKLGLRRQSIRALTADELRIAHGGGGNGVGCSTGNGSGNGKGTGGGQGNGEGSGQFHTRATKPPQKTK